MTAPGSPEGPVSRHRVTAGSPSAGQTVGPRHIPVLLPQVLAALGPKAGATYIDATFGAGGYSGAILEAADCQVLALDRDIRAVRDAAPLCAQFPNRLIVVEAPFSRLAEVARVHLSTNATDAVPSVFTPPAKPSVDGIVLDIGVSSMQIDQPERGFSFQADGPLDMRMSATGPTAADIVNTAEEEALANILFELGEERRSRVIARAIVHDRAKAPFTSTLQLAGLVARILGRKKDDGRHPATRTFQALRIYVNDELGELAAGLDQAERILAPGGRLVVVTFHSLEDRIVKRFLAERTGRQPGASRHVPQPLSGHSLQSAPPSFRFVNPRPVSPGDDELVVNPRARSARLRWAVKV